MPSSSEFNPSLLDILHTLRNCERVIDGELRQRSESLKSARDARSAGDSEAVTRFLSYLSDRERRLSDWSYERAHCLTKLPRLLAQTTHPTAIFDALALLEQIVSRLEGQAAHFRSTGSLDEADTYDERAKPYRDARADLLANCALYRASPLH
ncbi:hypothetical protein NVS55_40065 (plasmid) [Myxococcus stipitatus]|uniref:hypothetical protein n=1 Tax=Myxococcus stipitatus TaxID=83455 RepID=UPI0031450E74